MDQENKELKKIAAEMAILDVLLGGGGKTHTQILTEDKCPWFALSRPSTCTCGVYDRVVRHLVVIDHKCPEHGAPIEVVEKAPA